MKKLAGVFLAVCLLLFFSCSSSRKDSGLHAWMSETEKPKVLCTTAIVEDLVKQVGGDKICTISLIKGEMDPHSYELVKGDSEKITSADLIFSNGLGLEHGASISYALNNHKKHVPLADTFKGKEGVVLYLDGQMDPHVWMDVSLWACLVDEVKSALIDIDHENELYYAMQAQKVKKILLDLDKEIYHAMQKLDASKRYLVTSHDAFNYFARRYLQDESDKNLDWKNRFSAPEGLAPDGQLSMQDIEEIVSHLNDHKVKVLFPESNVSTDSLKKILEVAKTKNLHVRISQKQLYGDALGAKGTPADSYQGMMRENAAIIVEQIGLAHE